MLTINGISSLFGTKVKKEIVNFVDGIDRLGLSDRLIFDNLSFAQDGANTLIHDLTDNNKTLAVLFNVDVTDINADDFTLV